MSAISRRLAGGSAGGTIDRIVEMWRAASPDLKRRLVLIYALLVGSNMLAWGLLLLISMRYPLLLGLGPVAYGFGLRHAVDPDYIAAIDNTTRVLMQRGKRPVGVGLL